MTQYRSLLATAALAGSAFTTPLASQAQQLAYAAEQLTLRAGPAIEYPVVLVLPAGIQVQVLGCVTDYLWCDVVAGSARGWAYSGNLTYYHQYRHVPLNTVAAVVGIGLTAFVLNDYWHHHYRDRSWYHDRSYWNSRPYYQPRPPHHHHDRQADRRPSRQQAVPVGRDNSPSQPRALRNDPNSGWDSRNPDAPRADRP